jgi:integrase
MTATPIRWEPDAPALPPALAGMGREEFLAAMLRSWEAAAAGDQLWGDEQLVEQFLNSCSRTGSTETRQAYAREIHAFRKWVMAEALQRGDFRDLEDQHLRNVSPQMAERWVAWERSLLDPAVVAELNATVAFGRLKVRQPRSFNRRIAAVSALFRWASEPSRSGFTAIPRNPLPRRVMLEVAKKPNPLTAGDLDRVLDAITAAGNQRDLVLVKGAYRLGARVSELAALRWGDIQEADGGQGLVNLLGKGSKHRTIRVSADTLALFLSIKPIDASEADWVFPSGRRPGEHITRQAIGSRVRHWGRVALGAAARVYPHRMRSSHATHAVRAGVDVFTLQTTLGHSAASTTQSYVAANPADSSSLRLG